MWFYRTNLGALTARYLTGKYSLRTKSSIIKNTPGLLAQDDATTVFN